MTDAQNPVPAAPEPAKGWVGSVVLQTFCHTLIPVALVLFFQYMVPMQLENLRLREQPVPALGQTLLSVGAAFSQYWFVFLPLLVLLLVADALVIKYILLKKGPQQSRYWFFGVLAVQAVLLMVAYTSI